MRQRVLFGLAMVLFICALLVVFIPVCHFTVFGLVNRESFHDGWPTSYWVAALRKDPFVDRNRPRDVAAHLAKAGTAAVPVLLEMLDEPDAFVRAQALIALIVIDADSAAVFEAVGALLPS